MKDWLLSFLAAALLVTTLVLGLRVAAELLWG